jgi:excisionase family DNA binding protein
MERPQLLSVAEAAAELHASDAYVRRLLIRERLYGVKVGQVWAIYKEDLENFKRLRRPPGRPAKTTARPVEELAINRRMREDRADAHTAGLLRKGHRKGDWRPRKTQ